MKGTPEYPHLQYAHDVIKGRITAPATIKTVCHWILDDHETHDLQWRFDPKYGEKFRRFCELVPHVKGPEAVAREPFALSPWQLFIAHNMYGWRHIDDPMVRRFTDIVLFIARKNGKTSLSSLFGLYELMYSEDSASEAYTITPSTEQSKYMHQIMTLMIRRMQLKSRHDLNVLKIGEIENISKGHKYKALSSDTDSYDSKSPVLLVYDEASKITDPEAYHSMSTGGAARASLQRIYITTASEYQDTYFFTDIYQYSKDMLSGALTRNMRFLPFLYELDPKDRYLDHKVWEKANPNMRHSSTMLNFLENAVADGGERKETQVGVQMKQFNIWAKSGRRYMDLRKWDECEVKEGEPLISDTYSIGIDSSTSGGDFTSVVDLHEVDSQYHIHAMCFISSLAIQAYPKDLRRIVDDAVDAGELEVHEGAVVNYELVFNYILSRSMHAEPIKVTLDYSHGTEIYRMMSEHGWGTERQYDGHSPSNIIMRAPVKHKAVEPNLKMLSDWVDERNLVHDGSRFLRWQMSNAEEVSDKNEERIIKKAAGSQKNKIDFVDALVNAVQGMRNRSHRKRITTGMKVVTFNADQLTI